MKKAEPQIIIMPCGDRLVVIPEADFLAMREAIEDREDAEVVAQFYARLEAGQEELIPADVVDRLLDGENPVCVWRDHRGLSVRDLAKAAGISASYLSQIESGARSGSFDTIKKIAAALRLTVDELA
jgi:DNA-binding XRE family transcriptional regulator